MVLIKAGKDARYENVMDALNEVLIYDVKKYALVKIEEWETNWLAGHANKLSQ
jgi:hypothetical protein